MLFVPSIQHFPSSETLKTQAVYALLAVQRRIKHYQSAHTLSSYGKLLATLLMVARAGVVCEHLSWQSACSLRCRIC